MPAVDSAVLDKLQKILSRADTSRGSTEAEAQAAMAAAQRLAIQHNIDLASVVAAGDANGSTPGLETDKASLASKTRGKRLHHLPIARVLMQCFDVEFIWTGGGGNACIIGEKTDVALATYCWAWLGETFPRLYKEWARAEGIEIGSTGEHVRRRSYYDGLQRGISETNRRQREAAKRDAATGASFALVLVRKEEVVAARVAEEFPMLRKARASSREMDYRAYGQGHEAGRKIRLSTGLSGGSSQERLS